MGCHDWQNTFQLCLMKKSMTLDFISDSISSFSYIFDVVPIVFKAISKIVALAGVIPDGVVCFLV